MSAHDERRSARRPVLMMAPGGLADEVTRLAAAAGCDPQRIADLSTVREQWNCAPLVLLDMAAAMASANAGLPRRDGVVVISANGDPEVWQCAVAVGAAHVA
ncbi:MAG TPA: hypothetical protein VFN75_08445, partial [Pseudonocardiaceae bacterium]|nr:hypothetical protein [Pseudonocardiaceae bacterium]